MPTVAQENSTHHSGFTIVELLIVIVVIAVLAAISIVAYTGIQERALNTSRIAAARQTLNLLEIYKTTHGSYPEVPLRPTGGDAIRGACIGTGWPKMTGVNSPVCWNIYTDGNGPGPSTFVESPTLNAALAEAGTPPQYPQKPVYVGTHSARPVEINALALYWNRDGSHSYQPGYTLVYILPDDSDCELPEAEAYSFAEGAIWCRVHLGE